jgi:iron complex transport system permease protein
LRKLFFLIAFLILSYLSLFTGVGSVSVIDILHDAPQAKLLLFATRIPRTISLLLSGGILSVSGLLMQNLVQNKFVAPDTMGTMDSARLGMLVVMLVFPSAPLLAKSSIAFVFALLGTLIFLSLVRFLPQENKITIALIGVMFSNILGAVVNFFAYQFQVTQNISSWLQGNFALVMRGGYELLYIAIPVFLLIYWFSKQFMLVSLGSDFAESLGLNYERMRLIGIVLVAISSALVLVLVGNIPFLGIIIPNLISLKYGDYMPNTLAITAGFGSLFLMFCDILSRTVIAPYEIPVSVTVGIIGSILFIWILFHETRSKN